MPIAEQFAAAIAAARTYAEIENTSRLLWAAHAEGHIPDAAAQAAAEAVEARKATLKGPRPSRASKRAYTAPRPCRSPDRARSIARRRSVAASGAVPSKIACQLTQGQVAVLSIIGGEVRRAGHCDLPINKIAALAGVSRRLTQNAIRQAERLGLILVEARPRPGQKSLTNLIEVISPEWISWLKIGIDRVQKTASHEYNLFFPEKKRGFLRDWPLRSGALGGRISHQEVKNANRDDATGNNRRIYRD
jgi:hypothetical protein